MINAIKHYFAQRSLESQQRHVAHELQALYDQRMALTLREQYLVKRAANLAMREVEQNVVARRTHRAAL